MSSSYGRLTVMLSSNASLYHLANLLEWKRKLEVARDDVVRVGATRDRIWTSFLRFGLAQARAWEDTDIYPTGACPLRPRAVAGERSRERSRGALRHGLSRQLTTVTEEEGRNACIVQDEDASEEWVSTWWMRLRDRPQKILHLWSQLFYSYFPHSDRGTWHSSLAGRDRWLSALNSRTACTLAQFGSVLRRRVGHRALMSVWTCLSASPQCESHFKAWAHLVTECIRRYPRSTPAASTDRARGGWQGIDAVAAATMSWFDTMECEEQYPRCARMTICIVRWLQHIFRRMSDRSQTLVRHRVKGLVEAQYWSPPHKCALLSAAKPLFAREPCMFAWDDVVDGWYQWLTPARVRVADGNEARREQKRPTHRDECESGRESGRGRVVTQQYVDSIFKRFWDTIEDVCDIRAVPLEKFTQLAWTYLSTDAFRRWSRRRGGHGIDVLAYVRNTIRSMYLNRRTEAHSPERQWLAKTHAGWWRWYDASCKPPEESCHLAAEAGFAEACIAGDLPRSVIFGDDARNPAELHLNWWDWFPMLEQHAGWSPLEWFQHPLCTDDRYHPRTQDCIARWIYDWIVARRSVEGLRWFASHPWIRYCVTSATLGRWRTLGHLHFLRTVEQTLGIRVRIVAHAARCASLREVYAADNEHSYLGNSEKMLRRLEWGGAHCRLRATAARNRQRINPLPGTGFSENPTFLLRSHMQLRLHDDVARSPWWWIDGAFDDAFADILLLMIRQNTANLYFIGARHYVLEKCYEQCHWRVARLLQRELAIRASARCHFADDALCHHAMLVG